jgi:nucleophosmin 1
MREFLFTVVVSVIILGMLGCAKNVDTQVDNLSAMLNQEESAEVDLTYEVLEEDTTNEYELSGEDFTEESDVAMEDEEDNIDDAEESEAENNEEENEEDLEEDEEEEETSEEIE